MAMNKSRPLFGVILLALLFFVGLIFILSLPKGFAQEEKTPQATVTQEFFKAPQKFDRVDANKNKIFDDLEGLIGPAAAGDRFDVIVMAERPLEEILPALKSRHGDFSEKFIYPAINGFATTLNKGQIVAFSGDADIKQIEFDAPVYPHLDTSQQWFGTTKARADFGVDGNADGSAGYSKDDIVIAVLDTGIDPNHVDLGPNKIIAWRDATVNNNQSGPYDELGDCRGHGTHVSSIAAGEGQANPAYKGVAPGAALVGIKVLSNRSVPGQGIICTAATSEIVSGVQWMIDNKATYGIKIGNMSLGAAGCSNGTDSMSTIVNAAVNAGMVMAVSAGNEGPGLCTIGSPAAAEKAITVGAMADVTPRDSGSSSSCGVLPYRGFYLACFSSRGKTADNRFKPDIASPGVFINAALAGTTNGYQSLSGTSMSSPFTAGLAALMLDANPSLTTTQVKDLIKSTAIDWDNAGADIDYGAGRLDGFAAVKSAGSFSGTNISTPKHEYLTGNLTGTGDFDEFTFQVTDLSFPLAATLIMTGWTGSNSPDFDLEIRDGNGNPLFSCSGSPNSTSPCTCTTDSDGICKSRGVTRQETVGFQPTSAGNYKIRVVSFSGSGDYFFDTSFGEAAVAISITTDGTTPFGILALGAVATSSGDIQTVRVDTGPANLNIKSTNFSDGTNIWALGVTNGADQAKWEFSKDGTNWSIFSSANNLFTFDNNIAQGTTRDLYLKITMPTSTSSNNEHSSTVTIVASSP